MIGQFVLALRANWDFFNPRGLGRARFLKRKATPFVYLLLKKELLSHIYLRKVHRFSKPLQ